MSVDATGRRCATAAATRAVEAQRANHWLSTAATATVAAVTEGAVVGDEVAASAPAKERLTASAAGLQLRNGGGGGLRHGRRPTGARLFRAGQPFRADQPPLAGACAGLTPTRQQILAALFRGLLSAGALTRPQALSGTSTRPPPSSTVLRRKPCSGARCGRDHRC